MCAGMKLISLGLSKFLKEREESLTRLFKTKADKITVMLKSEYYSDFWITSKEDQARGSDITLDLLTSKRLTA